MAAIQARLQCCCHDGTENDVQKIQHGSGCNVASRTAMEL